MKVLYVLSRDDKFGAPRALLEMIKTLKKNHNICPIILTPVNNDINKICNELGIENYSIMYGTAMKRKNEYFKNILRWIVYKYGNTFSIKKISKIIDFNNIDLIHSNNSVIDFGYKLSKKYNKKHIWHLREFADLDFNYYPFDKKYITYMNDSNNIAISNIIYDHWTNKKVKNITLVYDGIDIDDIKVKKKYNESKIKFIFIGSLCETKGQLKFLNTILKLDKKIISNIEIHFFGTGEDSYIFQIKKLINENNLEKTIYLDGYTSNIRDIIKDYDIGIINSKSEAFGRVTVEYMASGLCVLASNTGANTEIINNNKTGIIFKYGDDSDIVKQITHIIQNRKEIKKIGINARKEVINKYTKEINARNIYKLYMSIVGDKNDI